MKPIPLAGCIILDDYGRILLLHRASGEYGGQWELPGGKVEDNETLETAAVREAAEELGVEVDLGAMQGNATFESGEQTYQYYWFLATIANGEPRVNEPDVFDDLQYLDFEDLPSLSLSANMQILQERIAGGELELGEDE